MFKEIQKLLGKNILRFNNNLKAYSVEFVSLTLLQLFIIPLMIKGWGVSNFGVWIFIMAIPGTLSLANIDVIQATRQELTLRYNKNTKYLNNLFSNSIMCTLLNLLIFGIFYFLLFLFFFDKFEVLNTFKGTNFRILTILIYLGVCLKILTENFLVVFDCVGNTSKTTLLTNKFHIMQLISIAMIGFFTNQLFFAGLSYFIVNLVSFSYSIFIIQNNKIRFSINNIKLNEIKKIFLISKSYYLSNFATVIYISGFMFLVGIFYSAQIVALIHALNTLFRWSISRVTSIFMKPFIYEFANYYKDKKYNLLQKLFNSQLKIVILMLLVYFFGSILFGEFIFNIWTLNKFDNFNYLLLLIVLENTIYIIQQNYLLYLKSINNFYFLSKIDFLLSIFVLISIYLLGAYGFNLETFLYILLLRSSITLITSRKFYLNQIIANNKL